MAGKGVGGAMAQHLARFDARHRQRVADCAALSQRLAQLAFSHPLLLFALATGYGPLTSRREAVRRAVDGRSLADVCAAVGLPLCLKRIAPEACRAPLTPVRWSAAANRELAPLIPRSARAAAAWLSGISFAHAACDERFALWVARQDDLFSHGTLRPQLLQPLAVFAWFSQAPQRSEILGSNQPWSAELGLKRAVRRTAVWLVYLRLVGWLGHDGLADSWLPAGEACGYRFEPLLTAQALLDEGRAMDNCAVRYAGRLARDESRLFSMRRHGRRIATVEIRRSPNLARLVIAQMRGSGNSPCRLDAKQAAQHWLGRHAEHAAGTTASRAPAPGLDLVQQSLASYQAAAGASRLAPRLNVTMLESALVDLAALVGFGDELRGGGML